MDSLEEEVACLLCESSFVGIDGRVCKRHITNKITRRNFTVLDVLRRLHSYQVVNGRVVNPSS